MAASDKTTTFSKVDGAATLYDGGANSLAINFVQSDIKWTIDLGTYTEAMTRGKHQATPVLRKTGDGNTTGSMRLLITSLLGSAAVTPYEFFTHTGGASAFTTTAAGDRKANRLVVVFTDPSTGGASQTVTFAYLVATSIAVDPEGGDGLMAIDLEFVDHENYPVVT